MSHIFNRRMKDHHDSSSQSGFRLDLGPSLEGFPSLATELRNPITAVGVTVLGTSKSKAIKCGVGQNDEVDDDNVGQTIFCIGSVSKLLINLVFCIIIEENAFPGFGWDKNACEWYNSLCNGGDRRIMLGKRRPTILELLLHRGAFAEINRFLFTPNEQFMVSSDDFLRHITTISDMAFPMENSSEIRYTNANHIFAVLILEKMFKNNFQWVLQTYLFPRFKMTGTTTDRDQLDEWRKQKSAKVVLPGHRVSGDLSRCDEVPKHLLGETSIAAALFGTWSCTDDLVGLFSQLFEAYSGPDNESRRIARTFFKMEATTPEYVSTLAGWLCDTTSPWLGRDSLNDLSKSENSDPLYTLGKYYDHGKVKSQKIFHKGGISDGFTSCVYIAPEHKLCVVVLANSAGPVDLTSHIGQSILQDILQLTQGGERVKIVDKIKENMGLLRQPLLDLENEDLDLKAWPDSVDRFVGIYEHCRHMGRLVIDANGTITFDRGATKSEMIVRARGSTIRLFPPPSGFGVNRRADSAWKHLTFDLQDARGRKALIGGRDGSDEYKPVEES